MTTQDPRDELRELSRSIDELEKRRRVVIARLRTEPLARINGRMRGLGWREIGELTGMSHEAARRRYG